jgi:hypothetical protein
MSSTESLFVVTFTRATKGSFRYFHWDRPSNVHYFIAERAAIVLHLPVKVKGKFYED